MIRGIRAVRPDAEITVISAELCGGATWNRAQVAATQALGVEVLGTPVPSRSMHGGQRVAWVSRLARSAAALACARIVGRWAARFAHPDDRPVWDALSNADVVLAKGGSYLYSYGGLRGWMFVWRMLHLLALSRALGNAPAVMGVTVGPVHGRGPRRMVRTTLAHCRRIYLREGLSEAYVAAVLGGLDSNVERAADMAFLLTPPAVPRTRSCHEPVVAVTIRAFPFAHRDTADSERERLSNVVVDTLTDLLEGNRLVRIVIVVQVAGDAEPSGTLRNRLARFEHRVTLVEPRHPDDLMSVYQRASVLVATRLHSTIYAALAGTPSVHIVSDAHKGFGISDDLGLRGWCVAAESVDREVLTARITSLMGDREVVSRQVSERINGLRRSAEKALGEALSLDAAFTP